MPKSTFLRNAVLNAVLAGTTFTSPTSLYVALFSGNPEAGGIEVSGASYVRKAFVFSTAITGITTNSNAVAFTNMPPVNAVDYVGVFNALTGGNLLYFAPAALPHETFIGDTISIAANAFSVTEN